MSWKSISIVVQYTVLPIVALMIFREAAKESPPKEAEVVVHLGNLGVDVAIDHRNFRIDRVEQLPIVCTLKSGPHTLRMTRAGRTLYEEVFTTRPGEDRILAAWNRTPRIDVEKPPAVASRPTENAASVHRHGLSHRKGAGGAFTTAASRR
jgi:hypothetical protein